MVSLLKVLGRDVPSWFLLVSTTWLQYSTATFESLKAEAEAARKAG
jgi:hypothetical protein